jgi:hypothetical protein
MLRAADKEFLYRRSLSSRLHSRGRSLNAISSLIHSNPPLAAPEAQHRTLSVRAMKLKVMVEAERLAPERSSNRRSVDAR